MYSFPESRADKKLNAAVNVGESCTCSFKQKPDCGGISGCFIPDGPDEHQGDGTVTAVYSDKHRCFRVATQDDDGFVSFLNCAHHTIDFL